MKRVLCISLLFVFFFCATISVARDDEILLWIITKKARGVKDNNITTEAGVYITTEAGMYISQEH